MTILSALPGDGIARGQNSPGVTDNDIRAIAEGNRAQIVGGGDATSAKLIPSVEFQMHAIVANDGEAIIGVDEGAEVIASAAADLRERGAVGR